MTKAVIFDIDGTLADLTHRLHHIRNGSHNWDGFFPACGNDSVIEPIRDLAVLIAQAGQPGGPGVGGSRGPNLAKIGAEPGHTAEYLAAYIRDPRSAKPGAKLMPAFGDKLSDAQIQELAEWLAAKK
ncbi:c-type cytochrome [Frigoriglobus tundricola]|uniref:c-type cytochrome n=1 Tax=Frigoriglobus tundricola TaxID=2774151 RepID=UPI001D0682A5|nr:c-type cytochrome [Frigoriglobus tundricola]